MSDQNAQALAEIAQKHLAGPGTNSEDVTNALREAYDLGVHEGCEATLEAEDDARSEAAANAPRAIADAK